jgi:putative ABC transport system ATP-binding protein
VSALVLKDVSRSRGQGAQRTPALRGVSLAVDAGEVVIVQGPSGSGKTTLLAVAGALLTPDAGTVELGGRALGSTDDAERRRLRARSVGFVFQRACLLERLSARDNLRLAAALAGLPADEAEREADALLERLGLRGRQDRHPSELSGGEEQRVAVARALVHRPAVILADEPTASLDGANGRAVAEALAALARERRAAVLLATHDSRLVPFGTRRLVLRDGELRAAA